MKEEMRPEVTESAGKEATESAELVEKETAVQLQAAVEELRQQLSCLESHLQELIRLEDEEEIGKRTEGGKDYGSYYISR